MSRSITKRQLAAKLPNNRGGLGVHPITIDRRIERKELPEYDWKFADGTAGWSGASLEHPNIAPFVGDVDEPREPVAA